MGCATSNDQQCTTPIEKRDGKQSYRQSDTNSSRASARIIAMRRDRREDRPIPTEEETLAVAQEIRRDYNEAKDREDAARLRRMEEMQSFQHAQCFGETTPLKTFKALCNSNSQIGGSDRATPSADGRLSLSVFDLMASDEDPNSGDDEPIDPATPQPFANGPHSPMMPGQLEYEDDDVIAAALGFSPRRKYGDGPDCTPRSAQAPLQLEPTTVPLHRSRSSSVGSLGSGSGNYSLASRTNSRRMSQRHAVTPLESIREKLTRHRMSSTSAHYKPSVATSALSDDDDHELALCPKHTPRVPVPGGQAVLLSPGSSSGLTPAQGRPYDHPALLPGVMARTFAAANATSSPATRTIPAAAPTDW